MCHSSSGDWHKCRHNQADRQREQTYFDSDTSSLCGFACLLSAGLGFQTALCTYRHTDARIQEHAYTHIHTYTDTKITNTYTYANTIMSIGWTAKHNTTCNSRTYQQRNFRPRLKVSDFAWPTYEAPHSWSRIISSLASSKLKLLTKSEIKKQQQRRRQKRKVIEYNDKRRREQGRLVHRRRAHHKMKNN